MAIFSLIIGNELAFNLEIQELNDGFYQTLQNNPKVVVCNGLDVAIGDDYIDGIFYSSGVEVNTLDQNISETKFAFIVDGVVSTIQNIPNANDMLVAAYSSDPIFIEQ